jgi:hypothetical protein
LCRIGCIRWETYVLGPYRPADIFADGQRWARNGEFDAIAYINTIGGDRVAIADIFGAKQPRDGFVGRPQKYLVDRAALQDVCRKTDQGRCPTVAATSSSTRSTPMKRTVRR